jgi:endonuclease YncB( thermonuclease family)
MTQQRTAGRISVLGIIAFVLLAALLLTLAVLSAVKGVRTAQSYGNVVRVVDGHTIVVNMDGTEETVTLAGVQAPLTAPEGKKTTLDNCLAEESTANLSGMLESGDSIQVQYVDGPGGTRLVLARSGGQVINVVQVEAGLAVPVRDQPMKQLGADLEEAQETARTEEAGLYSPSVDCTLPGRVAPVVDVLRGLPEGGPSSSAEADEQIEAVADAVEQGVTAEKVFATIDPEGTSLSSLAWGEDVPRLRQRLDEALTQAQTELASLQSTRGVLLTREREEAARQREEARQAELARQAEAARQAELARQEAARQAEQARQEAARQETARQEAAREDAREDERRRAEEEARRKAEESASPTPSKSASTSPSPSPSKPSSSSSSPRPSADDDDEESSGPAGED